MQCPEVMNTELTEALATLADALEYLRNCPPYAIDAAERYVERVRDAVDELTTLTEDM